MSTPKTFSDYVGEHSRVCDQEPRRENCGPPKQYPNHSGGGIEKNTAKGEKVSDAATHASAAASSSSTAGPSAADVVGDGSGAGLAPPPLKKKKSLAKAL